MKEEIGCGSFSKAYRATMKRRSGWDGRREKDVVVKMIDTSHPLYNRKRTMNEMILCQLVGKLPNVCTFHGCGGMGGDMGGDVVECKRSVIIMFC